MGPTNQSGGGLALAGGGEGFLTDGLRWCCCCCCGAAVLGLLLCFLFVPRPLLPSLSVSFFSCGLSPRLRPRPNEAAAVAGTDTAAPAPAEDGTGDDELELPLSPSVLLLSSSLSSLLLFEVGSDISHSLCHSHCHPPSLLAGCSFARLMTTPHPHHHHQPTPRKRKRKRKRKREGKGKRRGTSRWYAQLLWTAPSGHAFVEKRRKKKDGQMQ